MSQPSDKSKIVDNAVAEGGAYEIIRKRLLDQGERLEEQTRTLNEARVAEFGGADMQVVARTRVRTENNCIARDIVQVGECLLFGYNVFIGLKKETKIEDVFSLFKVTKNEDDYAIEAASLADSFLADSSFQLDFDELYRYYKHTRLVQLIVKHGKLLAGFQIGERIEDIRVFRWSVSADGKKIQYIDNRGERDIKLPASYDFEWQETSREDFVNGRHPHVNIADQVFVETIGGDLTIKVEDNTEDGLGIYSEPVEDKTQSMDDADIFYATVGALILLKIKPYKEDEWRYLIFNTTTQDVLRVDAIGESCVQLPEDHGLIFPGGYYLQTGEYKTFDEEVDGLKFKRTIRSPNGEDVLYVFYEPTDGHVGLFAYNLISKQLQNPIYGHGYALSENGNIVIFSAEQEPTRVHPMQIWETPYFSQEFASKEPERQTFFGRVGNAELVRGVSDLYSICRVINNQSVSSRLYEGLGQSARKMFDSHYWIEDEETQGIDSLLNEISETCELIIDEFEKVESIRQKSDQAMREAEETQKQILRTIHPDSWQAVEEFVQSLDQLRHQRGHLATIKEYRYIDLERIAVLDAKLEETTAQLSEKTVVFLGQEDSLNPYLSRIDQLDASVEKAQTVAELDPQIESIEAVAGELDLLSELMATLKVDDATLRTRIIDAISEVYAKVNKSKANARHRRKNMGSEEAVAQFAAQFKLFSQSITNALGIANTPEACDEQLSRLLVQLEELESQFSDYDQFLADIMEKREEVYGSFEAHKQQLLEQQQRKAQNISDAAERMLGSIEKRSLKFTEADDLNAYFASDALVLKVADLVSQLREIDALVKADDLESRFKMIKDQAVRSLRDKSDIYTDGGQVIKLGPRHKFSVNNEELGLTIIPRDDNLSVHLTGTNYFETIDHAELNDLRDYWDLSIESESAQVYRAEYLAIQIYDATQQTLKSDDQQLDMASLHAALNDFEVLEKLARDFATPRYKEGYQKGIHDHDAALILQQLVPAIERADLLRYDPLSRGLAQVFWANIKKAVRYSPDQLAFQTWIERAQSAMQMQQVFASTQALQQLSDEVREALTEFIDSHPIPVTELDSKRAADYLVAELGRERPEFIGSKYALELVETFRNSLDNDTWRRYQTALEKMLGWPAQRWALTTSWLQALVSDKGLSQLEHYIPEAVGMINSEERLDRRTSQVDLQLSMNGLLGDHTTIQDKKITISLDVLLQKLEHHRFVVLPAYRKYLQLRHDITEQERSQLRLEEFKARPLSSFVRNRLINDAYLPIIGDNLAKQMGTVGENKRTDLMGLLMMISPPGYGKTTLMEYVANRLGLIFMKINCPSLGHDVLSLDPEQAPNATAQKELNKLNLSLEMGNNVMLYLDDIQHTHPEFLQKFISLCDGTRRIEGVWKGETKTYDMRGRKFCVVMAGNPYTESGEVFKIPDMLANRADIYNLGDILGGMDEQFGLSYIENCLTSNPVLAPLAIREMDDVYKLIDMAKGKNIATTELSHQYSGAEINEITAVLKKLFVIQDVVLKINQAYIASAAQDDKYRTEPAFKLQGSYRNMNKMAEKISSVMNEQELNQMVADHYLGEAQLLTTGAEANLLKLAELKGDINKEQQERWEQIKQDFVRNQKMGGSDDAGTRIVAQLVDLAQGVETLGEIAQQASKKPKPKKSPDATMIAETLDRLSETISSNQAQVEVINKPVPGLDKALKALTETVKDKLFPLVESMEKKIEIDQKIHAKIVRISEQLKTIEPGVVIKDRKGKEDLI